MVWTNYCTYKSSTPKQVPKSLTLQDKHITGTVWANIKQTWQHTKHLNTKVYKRFPDMWKHMSNGISHTVLYILSLWLHTLLNTGNQVTTQASNSTVFTLVILNHIPYIVQFSTLLLWRVGSSMKGSICCIDTLCFNFSSHASCILWKKFSDILVC